MKNTLTFMLFAFILWIYWFISAADIKPQILQIDGCKKDLCSIVFMGKKYDVKIVNKTKSSLSFAASGVITSWVIAKPVYKQKNNSTMPVTAVETNSLTLDNGRMYVNFKTKVEQKWLEAQKKFLQDVVVGKEVTVYYNTLKDNIIAQWDIAVVFSWRNLVDLLNEKKPEFENPAKKFVEIVSYISKKTEQSFDLIHLNAGKLQVDYILIGEKGWKCSANLYKEGGKLYMTLFDINGPTLQWKKTPNVDYGKYYVSLVSANASCSISLKQAK